MSDEAALLRLTELVRGGAVAAVDGVLTLPFADRRRSRLRARLDDGREVALILPHGTVLRDGDRVRGAEGGPIVTVRAAEETLSWATAVDPLLVARAAYHLGNRHVPVQIGASTEVRSPEPGSARPGTGTSLAAPERTVGYVAYQHDHVLDGMIGEMGLHLQVRLAPFEPEAGGYRQGGHLHGGHAHES